MPRRNRKAPITTPKAAWPISEWGDAAGGLCRSSVYNLIRKGELQTAKVGSRRFITTPPATFIASKIVER